MNGRKSADLRNDTGDYKTRVNARKEGAESKKIRLYMESKVIGQERAIRHILRAIRPYLAGINDPRRPIGVLVFAGPTGVGKTFAVKVLSRAFLGLGDEGREDYYPITIVDCGGYQREHEVAKLIGSPPGYVGHDNPQDPRFPGTPSLLDQSNIDRHHFEIKIKKILAAKSVPIQILEKLYREHYPYRSVILFDEIEKAHPALHDLLLRILDEGELQLGNNRITRFQHSLIVLTTNLGAGEIQRLFKGRIGFVKPSRKDLLQKGSTKLDDQIFLITKEAIRKEFKPELFNRLKDIVVFRTLKYRDYEQILENLLAEGQKRLDGRVERVSRLPILIQYAPGVKEFLLEEGISLEYGVRPLITKIEKYVWDPIGRAIELGGEEGIQPGDKILIKIENGKTVILRKHRPRGQNSVRVRQLKPRQPEKKMTSSGEGSNPFGDDDEGTIIPLK